MKKTTTLTQPGDDLLWLSDVREVRHPLNDVYPIFIRETRVAAGDPLAQPTTPFPERHPYCELSINLEGLITQFVGGEKLERRSGDIMLMGPETPHFALRHSYPHHTITVYFLPLLFFEMGPKEDGAWVLSRFTAPQSLGQRVIRPPRKLRLELIQRVKVMIREFKEKKRGSELKLWGLLVEFLVDLLRWENGCKKHVTEKAPPQDWAHLEKALRYLHQHFAEPLYIAQVASQVGVSPNRLRDLFRTSLGMSCSHYLHFLRISQAKSRLSLPDARVTDVALNVGFETLSHFNTSFRKLTGMSPTQYIHSLSR